MKDKYLSTKITCYIGFVVQAIINNFLPILFIALQDGYGLSYEKLANLILVNFAVQMAVDMATPFVLKLVGYRGVAVLCQFSAGVGLVLISVLPEVMANTYLALIIGIFVYAAGSGMMEVILSPMVEMLPTKNKESNMAFLHSFYCWGQAFTILGTTALVSFFGFGRWNTVPLIWSVIPFLNSLAFLKVPIVTPPKERKLASFGELIRNRDFLVYMLMMICAGASEISMAEWSSMFAQRSLGVSKVIGDIAGPCAFALLMATGRVLYALFSNRLNFMKLLSVLGTLTLLCYLSVALSHNSVISLIACALCGLGVSVFWPGLYSAGAKNFPRGGMIMFSVFAVCGDTGCSAGPWTVGMIADRSNLNLGFVVASVFPILMIVSSFYIYRKTKKQEAFQ